MLAVSPSLILPYANFLCKSLELQECERWATLKSSKLVVYGML